MATRYSILAWEIPWTEEPGGYSPWGCKELDTPEQLNTAQQVELPSYPGLEAWTEVFQKCHISQGL